MSLAATHVPRADYITWLLIGAIPGIAVGVAGYVSDEYKNDTEIGPWYAVFVALWATVYLEAWKRLVCTYGHACCYVMRR